MNVWLPIVHLFHTVVGILKIHSLKSKIYKAGFMVGLVKFSLRRRR